MTGVLAAWRTGSGEDVGAAQTSENSALYLPKNAPLSKLHR